MADTTITPTDVISSFGSYYLDHGQNQNSLLLRPFFPFGTRDAFTNIPTNETVLRYSDVTVAEILQAYQSAYTPKGSVVFTPVTVSLYQVKVDQQFNPNALVNSWLGFLTNNQTDRKTWPFIRWFIDVYLMNQIMDDLEQKVIYTGSTVAPTPGTAGNAIDAITGIKKIINDAITATTITPITSGAPATDPKDWCTQVEDFVKQVPKKYWQKQMTLNMSMDLALRYVEGRDQKYNLYYSKENSPATVKNFSNITVKGRQSMDGASKIWMTPIENAVFPVKGFGNAQGFELESVDRSVKIWTDFWIGIGFLLKDLIFTNDQDLS